MKDLFSFFENLLPVVDHLLPVFITGIVFFGLIFIRVGIPYIKHITLVTAANNIDGETRLAKHLARQAGGKKIQTDHIWPEFIPAARELHKDHIAKRIELGSKN